MSDEQISLSVVPDGAGSQYLAPAQDTVQFLPFEFNAPSVNSTGGITKRVRVNARFNTIYLSPSGRGFGVVLSFSGTKTISDGATTFPVGDLVVNAGQNTQMYRVPSMEYKDIEVSIIGNFTSGSDIATVGFAYLPDTREMIVE